MGKLFGIGVGPGDPELLTIKAKRIINEVDYLFCPVKREGAESFAFEIVSEHIENNQIKIVNLVFPMNYQEDELNRMWKKNGAIISEILSGNKTGAFITLGDPAVYSTFMYVLPYVDSVDVEIVPGITSFCDVACKIKVSLMVAEESLAIVPVRKKNNEELGNAIVHNDNIVLMKPSNNPEEIIKMLKDKGLEKKFTLISKVGTNEENIIDDIETLEKNKIPYLSTMIIKKDGMK
ncbi:MAG: precorrin-2 C(20)-methyltransferase [Bacillota bacterium]|nr:precorrin-2 C(20)-methyltransferase [Bacillota bacterium]